MYGVFGIDYRPPIYYVIYNYKTHMIYIGMCIYIFSNRLIGLKYRFNL